MPLLYLLLSLILHDLLPGVGFVVPNQSPTTHQAGVRLIWTASSPRSNRWPMFLVGVAKNALQSMYWIHLLVDINNIKKIYIHIKGTFNLSKTNSNMVHLTIASLVDKIDHRNCISLCSFRCTVYNKKAFSWSIFIWERVYFFLENYVSSKGAVSHNV